jgi:hypothetical protein
MNKPIPSIPAAGSVYATMIMKSAIGALVMNVFLPLRIQPPSPRTALVSMARTSEPALGSVRPKALTFSPVSAGTR